MKAGASFCTRCGKKTSIEKTTTKTKVILSLFALAAALLLAFIIWRNTPYWPWLSNDEIEERLEKVIDACVDREKSSDCERSKRLYHAKFQYCVKVKNLGASLWSITGENEGIYAVAWLDSYSTPNEMTDTTGINMITGYKYVSCKDTKGEVDDMLLEIELRNKYFK